jgi:hypothetical protein
MSKLPSRVRYGSESMEAIARSGGKIVINNYASINVTDKDADSFKKTENQIYKDINMI